MEILKLTKLLYQIKANELLQQLYATNLLTIAINDTMFSTVTKNDKLYEFFLDVLRMPYYKNKAAESGAAHNECKHENVIANLLTKHGFSRVNRNNTYFKTTTSVSKKINPLMFWERHLDTEWNINLKNDSFIEQPFGKNANPDFIVKWNDVLIPIEAKSSETTTHPTFNSCLPKRKCIYIFCCKKHNASTIYRGCDIVSEAQRDLFSKVNAIIKKICDEENKKIHDEDDFDRGLELYHRPMYVQKTSKTGVSTDYFKHPNKEKSERNTLEWIKSFM